MSLKNYAVMPYSDYEGACDAIREKDGSSDPIKSGDLRSKILGIETGADVSVVTATAPDVLSGKIIVDANGNPLTGTMPNNGAGGGAISSVSQSIAIPEGYYNGNGTASISSAEKAKIIATNIRSGVSLLGVAGSATVYTMVSGSFSATDGTSIAITNSNIKAGQSCIGFCVTGGSTSGSSVSGGSSSGVIKTAALCGTTKAGMYYKSSGYGSISSVFSVSGITNGSATLKTNASYPFNGTYTYTFIFA